MKPAVTSLGLGVFILIVSALSINSPASAQQNPAVSIVRIEEYKPGLVAIYYDLSGEVDKKYQVVIKFSPDGGAHYSIQPSSVSGDVGKGVLAGKLRKMIWEVKKDYPPGYSDKFRCQITASLPKNNWPYYLAAGGGALIVGGVIYLLSRGGGGEEESNTGTLVIVIPSHP